MHPSIPPPLIKLLPSLTTLRELEINSSVIHALLRTVALSANFVPLISHRWLWFCTGSIQYTSNPHCLPSATFRNLGYCKSLLSSNSCRSLQSRSAATPHMLSAAAGCRLAGGDRKHSANDNTGIWPGHDPAGARPRSSSSSIVRSDWLNGIHPPASLQGSLGLLVNALAFLVYLFAHHSCIAVFISVALWPLLQDILL
jgi:hypothetical protein